MALMFNQPTQQQKNKQTGTGFTNLNRLIGVNQNNRLGSAIGQGLSSQVGQAQQSLGQANQQFQEQAQKNRLDTEANKQKVQTVLADPTKATDQDVTQFQNFREGRYAGPKELGNQENVQGQVQSAQSLANLGQTAGGRQALLQRFVGGAGYTPGKQRLDTLLLGQSQNTPFREGRRDAQALANQTNQSLEAARQQGQFLTNQAQQFGKDVTQQVQSNYGKTDAEIQADYEAAKQQEDLRSALYNQIRSTLGEAGTRTAAQNLSDQKQTDIDKLNNVLNLAKQNNMLNDKDLGMIQEMYTNLQTPQELLHRRQNVIGAGGMLGYGRPETSNTTVSEAGNIYSNLGLEEVLNNAFKTQAAQNLSKTGVASDIQRAKAQALAKLGGMQTIYDPKAEKFKASSAGFDVNQAAKDVDAEIARLKNESIVDLPTEYTDIPLVERLRRGFAPTGAENAQDITQDVSGVLGGDKSVGERTAALARLGLLAPIRTSTGLVINPTIQAVDQANKDINKVIGGDVGQKLEGAASLSYAPISAPANAIAGVADLGKGLADSASNAVNNAIPGGAVGKAAMIPLTAPIDFFGAGAEAAGDAARAVANPISAVKNMSTKDKALAVVNPSTLVLKPVAKAAKKVVKTVTGGSFVCTELLNRGLITREEYNKIHDIQFSSFFRRGRFASWYIDNGQRMVELANQDPNFDWNEIKKWFFDDVLYAYALDNLCGESLYGVACKKMCDKLGLDIWKQNLNKNSFIDSLIFLPKVLLFKHNRKLVANKIKRFFNAA